MGKIHEFPEVFVIFNFIISDDSPKIIRSHLLLTDLSPFFRSFLILNDLIINDAEWEKKTIDVREEQIIRLSFPKIMIILIITCEMILSCTVTTSKVQDLGLSCFPSDICLIFQYRAFLFLHPTTEIFRIDRREVYLETDTHVLFLFRVILSWNQQLLNIGEQPWKWHK